VSYDNHANSEKEVNKPIDLTKSPFGIYVELGRNNNNRR